jgi:lipopolysaccharide/colanic/teichoic acid biosynthesis glycosyltransferase
LEIARNLLNPLSRSMKSILEWLVTFATLPFWLPLLMLIALAIVLEGRGGPFFRQERIGRAGRTFKVLKFRTMRPDAEEHLKKCLEADPRLMQEWKSHCKLKNDPRITVVGKWLRRTSLDELPQLVNVLFGQMSLVGPRPLPPYHRNQLPARVLALREQVLPGITGLWQVSGRSDSGNEGIERWDTYYVRNWSIWLDIVILSRTGIAVFAARGAY